MARPDAVGIADTTDETAANSNKLILPAAPATECGPVKAWMEPVVLRTYLPGEPDRNPLFLEKRAYQGSNGCVYPLPVIDHIATEPTMQAWQAVHIENEYLRVMILPEIGGRIHVAQDKVNGYDFFYRQNVIKPALVGLAGPWISGGAEFNWPQHHRPATFMPTEAEIERDADGSVTVWCGDHDPMERMKGMHGVCLRPGCARLELRVRLYNRTMETHTFLWWANVAVHVHEQYQSFFPRDARFVADHAKRAVTEFPLCLGEYYGVDYGERARKGVPPEEQPAHFVPDGSYKPNDLSWYANIPVPTSYMVVGSKGDYSGGYDHRRQAGVVAVANHHIAPGKKQWTWGNHDFGYAWDRSLTDGDGPYVELMSGVYTDNQPDFSFLAPGESRVFSQHWYPIREIGVPDEANLEGALRVETSAAGIGVHVQVTSLRRGCTVVLKVRGQEAGRWEGDLSPETPLHYVFGASASAEEIAVTVKQGTRTLLRYAQAEIVPVDSPRVAEEPVPPEQMRTTEELYLTGLHLEQYRHPTRAPEQYWQEALRRDPGDSRCNYALGRWHLRRGEFALAEERLRAAIERLTEKNPNPEDGGAYYSLGMALAYQARQEEAYAAFYKATWNAAWRGPAYHRLAEIDNARGDCELALEHVEMALRLDADNLNARNLKVMVLRALGRAEAEAVLAETQSLDRLDIFSRYLAAKEIPHDGQMLLDLALELHRCGQREEALGILLTAETRKKDGSGAMLLYLKAQVLRELQRDEEANAACREAAAADPAYVFPSRLEELLLLEEAMRRNPADARAPYYLGNLFYHLRRHEEAIKLWELAARLDPRFATTWRNLGFGYFNVQRDRVRALEAFEQARDKAPADARMLYEYDQLLKRTGRAPQERLEQLRQNMDLVQKRDDLTTEMISLLNSVGATEEALRLLLDRQFQPWEGGEGQVLAQYVRARLLLAQTALRHGDTAAALDHLRAAQAPPENLGEAKHLLANMSVVDYWMGVAYERAGDSAAARKHLARAAHTRGDFQRMQVQQISEMTYWSAMALKQLKREDEAAVLLWEIRAFADTLEKQTPKIDYFATSLPTMLLFEEDLNERQATTVLFLRAQAAIGMGSEFRQEGSALLHSVLQRDRNHQDAIDLLRELED